MSGGHFDYSQFHISNIAEEIEHIIENNERTEKDRWGDDIGCHFSPETIEKFTEAVRLLKEAYIYAQRIDWLLSGDDGEQDFLSRLGKSLEKL